MTWHLGWEIVKWALIAYATRWVILMVLDDARHERATRRAVRDLDQALPRTLSVTTRSGVELPVGTFSAEEIVEMVFEIEAL